jgi:serine protease Do
MKIKKWFYMLAAGLIFASGIIVASIWEVPEDVSAKSEKNVSSNISTAYPSFVDVVKQKKPSVVNISTTRIIKRGGIGGHSQPPLDPFRDFFGDEFIERFFGQSPKKEYKTQNLGSGFIISKDGYIITNNHVIENADEIIVRLTDEREFKAEIIGRDAKTDLALIKIKDHDDLPVAVLGDSDNLEVGEWVIAIGNPFGVGQTVTAGIVSAKGREIGAGPYDDFIQTDASINPGNSGGPLFNIRGEVVAINTAIYSPSGGNVGIGFAIPVNMAKRLLPQLKEKGSVTRGWLGVMIQPISKELAETFDLPSEEGALVADVVKDSPADKAGLKRGDVIISFDDEKIGKMRQLPAIVAAIKVGSKVKLKVIRDGKEKTFSAKIERLASEDDARDDEDAKNGLGMSVQDVTPDVARRLDVDPSVGVIVTMLERGGVADLGGIRRGDIILEINRKEINDVGDFKSAIKRIKKGDAALFLIYRDGNTFYRVLKVDM